MPPAAAMNAATAATAWTALLEVLADKLATSSTLVVTGTNLSVAIGRLNTHDDATAAGWKARLFNLGFLVDPTLDLADPEVVFALQDFQAEHAPGRVRDVRRRDQVQAQGRAWLLGRSRRCASST